MKIPEWLSTIASDSAVSARDISVIFGITTKALLLRVSKNQFPEADLKHKGAWFSNKYYVRRKIWRAGTVRNFLKQLPEEK